MIGIYNFFQKVFTNLFFNSIIKLQTYRFYVNDSIILTNIRNLFRFFSIKKEYL